MNDSRALTVSELTRQVKDLVESNWPTAWVVGEISNCTRAGSGHVYFTLKDDSAQLRAVMWRSRASRVKFDLHDGLEVVANGAIEVYEARGTYQLIVEQLIPQGVGALELAFRQLQEKLSTEGLFDPDRKRPLPSFPRRIALITSPSSAAVRDMLQVITRRWQTADIVIVPVAVQGQGAAEQIAAALRMVHEIPDVDVVIVGRGGGSLEDHEIDVTIADLVADRRALTPSEAAELVVPKRDEVTEYLRQQRERLGSLLRSQAQRARLELDAIASRRVFVHPLERVHDLTARVDETAERLRRAAIRRVETDRRSITESAARLHAVSPLNVLGRGYSVTYKSQTDTILRDADEVSRGEEIITWLARGHINSRVESIDATSERISRVGEADRG